MAGLACSWIKKAAQLAHLSAGVRYLLGSGAPRSGAGLAQLIQHSALPEGDTFS